MIPLYRKTGQPLGEDSLAKVNGFYLTLDVSEGPPYSVNFLVKML